MTTLLRKNAIAHEYIANTCVELAQWIFEQMAMDNRFHGYIKEIDAAIEAQEIETTLTARALFVRALAPQLRTFAPRILAAQLADATLDESVKKEIFEAIMLDKMIPERASLN